MDKKAHYSGGIASLLMMMGMGAGLMYLYDPQTGSRRRALLRDKVVGLRHDAERVMDGRTEDVQNRLMGAAAEAKKLLKREPVDDATLAARVKTHLGRHMVTNPSAIEVTVLNGVVTLYGQVLAEEVQRILRATSTLHGVKSVENRLQVYQQ